MARVVVPDIPHHIVQLENRRLEKAYWEAWENGVSEEKLIRERHKPGLGGKSTKLVEKIAEVKTKKGNPAFLEGIRDCQKARAKLLALDAPAKEQETQTLIIEARIEGHDD